MERDVRAILGAALEAAQPERAVEEWVKVDGDLLTVGDVVRDLRSCA